MVMKEIFYSLFNCLVCQLPFAGSRGLLCEYCQKDLAINTNYTCKKCLSLSNSEFCESCLNYPPYYDSIIAAGFYSQPVVTWLYKLKYQKQTSYSKLLSSLLYSAVMKDMKQIPDYIIPVPIHIHRLCQRGFNQVEELLTSFKKQYKSKIISAVRHRHDYSQVLSSRTMRVKQIANNFAINKNIQNKSIAIVDDVVTTRATVNELASLCKNLGANHVQVWCLLRSC